MSEDMTGAGDTEALAAEFVLGTLEPDERSAAQDLLAEDEGFATKVKVWERRLGELHLMVEPVEPEPDIWQRIKAKLPEVKPEPLPALAEIEPEVAPEPEPAPESKPEPWPEPEPVPRPELKPAPERWSDLETKTWPAKTWPADIAAESVPPSRDTPPTAPDVIALPSLPPWPPEQVQTQPATPAAAAVKPEPSATVEPSPGATDAPGPPFAAVEPAQPAPTGDQDAKLSSIRRHLAGWRAVAVLMTLAVFAVAALLGLWRYEPERVPPVLRPLELMRLVGIKIDTAANVRVPAPPESRFDE